MQLTTFIRGLSIGFILGVLFAPDKGSATRRKLSNAAADIGDDMAETGADIKDMVSETASRVKRGVNKIAGKAKDGFEDVKDDLSIIGNEGDEGL